MGLGVGNEDLGAKNRPTVPTSRTALCLTYCTSDFDPLWWIGFPIKDVSVAGEYMPCGQMSCTV